MKEKMENPRDTIRKKAARYFVLFLLFMLLCTLISRGIYAYQMPRVEIGQAAGKTISHTISAGGNIETAKQRDVVVEEGIRIREVCVKVGEKVEKGTALLQLDTSDLQELITDISKKIAVQEEKMEAFKRGSRMDQQAVKAEYQRAKKELSRVRKEQKAAVLDAQKAYEEAREKQNAFPAQSDYVSAVMEEARKNDVEYQIYQREAEKTSATQEDKDAFEIYKKNFQASVSAEWKEKRDSLDEDVTAKKQALNTAKKEMKSAILSAEHALETAKKEIPTDRSTVMEEENTLAQMKKQRSAYQQLLDNKGKIVSEREGTVIENRVTAGDRTPGNAVILLTDASGGWNFKAVLTEEQCELIKVEDTVALKFQNGKKTEENCRVSALCKTEDGMYEAIVRVEGKEHFLGETGTLEMTSQSEQYSCCVPLTALYSDNNRDYVLLIRETETILGTELSVIKREVAVVDQNESNAALENGALEEADRFVVYASKEIMPGDKVRRLEKEDDIHPFQAVAAIGQSQTKICDLKEPVAYDKTLERRLEQLSNEGIDVVLWSEHASETITNADYNRSVEVKAMGVAGDASVLFPGGNRLPERTGQTGFCVLGEDTAWQLFGSTKITGRSVEIQGETYYVAGIEYQEKELCAYGLMPDGKEEITGVAVHVENREQMGMDVRKAERWLGVEILK